MKSSSPESPEESPSLYGNPLPDRDRWSMSPQPNKRPRLASIPLLNNIRRHSIESDLQSSDDRGGSTGHHSVQSHLQSSQSFATLFHIDDLHAEGRIRYGRRRTSSDFDIRRDFPISFVRAIPMDRIAG